MTLLQVFQRTRAGGFAGLLALVLGCGCTAGGRAVAPTGSMCAELDSFYAHSGFEVPLKITGKATIDADQQQIRGIIQAEFYPSGDIYFDFSSSVLFGSHIEDFFFSVASDTLRIVDRERGEFYTGNAAAEFLRDALGMDFDVVSTLRLAAGGRPQCKELDELRVRPGSRGEFRFDGRYSGEGFRVHFAGPHQRLDSAEWPVHGDAARADRLDAHYRWAKSPQPELRQIVMRLQNREWRCKITATN